MPSKNGHTPNDTPAISTEMLQPTVVFVALDLDVERTRNKIIALAKSLNVKLPDGWEHDAIAVPVNGKAKRGQK